MLTNEIQNERTFHVGHRSLVALSGEAGLGGNSNETHIIFNLI